MVDVYAANQGETTVNQGGTEQMDNNRRTEYEGKEYMRKESHGKESHGKAGTILAITSLAGGVTAAAIFLICSWNTRYVIYEEFHEDSNGDTHRRQVIRKNPSNLFNRLENLLS